MPRLGWRFEKVGRADADFETRAVLQVTGVKRKVLVSLHLPHLTYWSDPILLSEAIDLMERDRRLIPVVASVHVIDDMDLWPSDWASLA